MNRANRRASLSSKNQGHATRSFSDLVGQANLNTLKPYIEEMVENSVEGARQNLAQFLLNQTAGLQSRLMVLERIVTEKLGVTPEEISERLLEVEDDATGHTKTDAPIEKGDLIRMTLQIKRGDADESKFGKPANVLLHRVAAPVGPDRPYQTYKEVEEGLIGAVVGETRDFKVTNTTMVPDPDKPGSTKAAEISLTFRAKVDRVSRNPKIVEQLKAWAEANAKAEAEEAAADEEVSEQPPAVVSEQVINDSPEVSNGDQNAAQ